MLIIAAQYIGYHREEQDAKDEMARLIRQERFAGGRLLPPVGVAGRTAWRVQAFFEAQLIEESLSEKLSTLPLPQDCEWVTVPEGLIEHFGIKLPEPVAQLG